MADSSSEEKTEKPSAQKLRKAREEGQLPRSKDMDLQQFSVVCRFCARELYQRASVCAGD